MPPARIAVAVATVVISLFAAGSATAAAAEPLQFTSLTPASGATLPASEQVNFEMRAGAGYPAGVSVEVSTQPTLGQDGTLADDFLVERALYLQRSDASPDIYRGTTATNPTLGWIGTPGTYYWQVKVSYEQFDAATGRVVFHDVAGPVQQITVRAAPAVRLLDSEAARVVRSVLKQRYGSAFTHRTRYKQSCLRLSAASMRCSVSWRSRGAAFAGNVTVRKDANQYLYWPNVRRVKR